MPINVIRDGWVWRQRAAWFAAREVQAAPHLWSEVTVTALTAWLLREAGALIGEMAVWMDATPRMLARLLDDFEAQLALGTDQAAEARARLAALAEEMGVIAAPEPRPVHMERCSSDRDQQRTVEIIAFPRTRLRRAVMRAGIGGGAA